MVLISHKHRFIYIKNIKVASTSVEAFFEPYCIDPREKHVVTHRVDEKVSKYGIIGARQKGNYTVWHNHMTAEEIKKNIGNWKFDKYFKFSVVRNPYDKMVSLFHWRGNAFNDNIEEMKKEFKEFCKTNGCNSMRIHTVENVPICNFYIRYENLDEDVEKVCNRLKLKCKRPIRLPYLKTQTRPKRIHYREYYDDETKEIVFQKHRKEITYFGYEF